MVGTDGVGGIKPQETGATNTDHSITEARASFGLGIKPSPYGKRFGYNGLSNFEPNPHAIDAYAKGLEGKGPTRS